MPGPAGSLRWSPIGAGRAGRDGTAHALTHGHGRRATAAAGMPRQQRRVTCGPAPSALPAHPPWLGWRPCLCPTPPRRGTLLSGPRTRLAAGFGDSHFRCMFESMLTSRLISADVCGTVMDSLSVQMAQVPPCPRLRVACAPRAPRRFAAALDAGAYGACACPLVGGRGAGRSGSWVGRSSAQTGSSLLRIQRAPPGGGRGARCSGGSLVTASRHGSRTVRLQAPWSAP